MNLDNFVVRKHRQGGREVHRRRPRMTSTAPHSAGPFPLKQVAAR
jgi:hypothetical protein